jgi:peptidoglycan/xylan/chitin deacetylase (PgdA/CDA1 family)
MDLKETMHRRQSYLSAAVASLFPSIVFSGPATRAQIALTFDDGPHPVHTLDILKVLQKAHMVGTFFMTGANISAHRDIVKRCAGEGHEIGNHTFTHLRAPFHARRTLSQEIQKTSAVIEEITGQKPALFRPPYGLATPVTQAMCRACGLRTILWSTNTHDYAVQDAQRIVKRATHGLRPGAILLFHEGHFSDPSRSFSETIRALEALAPIIATAGMQAVTVSRLLCRAGA